MIKVGLFGIGLDTYWKQFEGLLDKLKGYQDRIREKKDSPMNKSIKGPSPG